MSLPQLARSAWHTRPTQLGARLLRIARCRLHDGWPDAEARRLSTPPPPVEGTAPRPLFEPRLDRARQSGSELQACFLNIAYPLALPVDWRAPGLVELQAMNLHYMEYLEAVDDVAFAALVEDWISRNPVGRSGSWRIGWNSFVISLRALVWMQQLALHRDRLSPETLAGMHASLAVQLRFLERHLELDIGGNHLIKNAKTLLWGGHYFTGAEAQRWRDQAERLLAREVNEQILPDGMHYERSPGYHLQVLSDLLECWSLASDSLRRAVRPALERMLQVAADLTHPDGLPSLFNDGGLNMTYSTSECLAVADALGFGTPVPRAALSLPQAGYFGLRSGTDYLLVDCGPVGPDHLPAHGHGDALAFEWTLGGQRLVVDAGVFEYERGPWRDLARATRSHNTVTLDDLDQSEFWAAFRVGRRARARVEHLQLSDLELRLTGSHDGYRHLPGSPRHRRSFVAAGDGLEVRDEIEGGRGQVALARLLLHPSVTVETKGRGAVLRLGTEVLELESDQPVALTDAWWFPDFGVRQPTRCLVIEYGPAPCGGRFRVGRSGAS